MAWGCPWIEGQRKDPELTLEWLAFREREINWQSVGVNVYKLSEERVGLFILRPSTF